MHRSCLKRLKTINPVGILGRSRMWIAWDRPARSPLSEDGDTSGGGEKAKAPDTVCRRPECSP